MNPRVCSCGAAYVDFKTNLTFSAVKRMMYAGDDPATWRAKGRSSVLGYWRELKLGFWNMLHGGCDA